MRAPGPADPPGSQWPITEPYPVLSGGQFSGPPVRQSDDPLVRYQWPDPLASDSLQVYQLRPVTAVTDTPASFTGLGSVTTAGCSVGVRGTGSVRFDFGVESPAWLEFDSPDFSGAVEMSISEYNQPAVENPGPANPVKTLAPVRYGNSFRLELNADLYEGLRFGWIHVTTFDQPWHITAVRAVSQVKPTNYTGSFSCSDEMLTRIWYTGAYGVKANLFTNYFGSILMDRGDRIAWAGDAYAAQAAALAAFGDWDFVAQDFSNTIAGNGIESYELYWVLGLLEYFQHSGDTATLAQFTSGAIAKLQTAAANYDNPTISFYGHDERLGACFEAPQNAETQSAYRMLFIRACTQFAAAMTATGDQATAATYASLAAAKTAELKADPAWYTTLGVHALADAVNAGVVTDAERGPIIEQEFTDRLGRLSFSPFNQYFILGAMAGLGQYQDALTTVRDMWGGTLDYGGTLYFEVFRPDWLAIRDTLDPVPHCQVGFTSMGHAWGGGVTAWLSQEVLGISPTSPGFATADIIPHLGQELTWVEGSMKTPGGPVRARFDVRSGKCSVTVPAGTLARVGLPAAGATIAQVTAGNTVVWDGQFHPVPGIGGASTDSGYVYLEGVQAGDWQLRIHYASGPPHRSPAPVPPFSRPVRFTGQDTATGGSWPGHYGSDGYVLFSYDGAGVNRQQLPAYVQSVTPAATRVVGNCLQQQVASATTDRRALVPPGGGTTGSLGALLTEGWTPIPLGMTMSVDIATTPGMTYQLALYCADFERDGRQEVIEVLDLQTLKLAAPVALAEDFGNGTYLIYECDRPVRLRVDHLHGDNAVLNAVFFDPVSG